MSRTGEKRIESAHKLDKARKRPKNRQAEAAPRLSADGISSASVNELTWREVIPPERLDDAEGFFGLEEIDDVEVLRDAAGANTRFRTLIRAKPSPSGAPSLPSEASHPPEDHSYADGEWSGFSDGEDVVLEAGRKNLPEQIPDRGPRKSNGRADGAVSRVSTKVPYHVLNDESQQEAVDMSGWDQLPLSGEIRSAIAGLGFPRPTPIQSAVIPEAVSGHDVVGKAVTGSGKTLAFAIPIFQYWLARTSPNLSSNSARKKPPTALILTPTRELAHQLVRHFENLVSTAVTQPRTVCITGGLSVQKQIRQLVDVDIIIATPGRLWDMLNSSDDLSHGLARTKFLVIDEADRLLSEGHFQEVENILELLDRSIVDEVVTAPERVDIKKASRQTLIFSATFHKGLQRKLAGKSQSGQRALMSNKQSLEYLLQKVSFRESRPKFIDVNPSSQMAQRLQQGLVECPALEKDLYLYSILIQRPQAKTLVFTNSISSVRRLTLLLKNLDLPASALHANMEQKARLRNVERFSEADRPGEILVATDVAARGLDIQNIDLVLHYHVPRAADVYIHRSGRTARVDNPGESILFCSPDEVVGVTKLISQIHRQADSNPLEPVHVGRQFVARLRSRVTLSQKITSATSAKEKFASQDEWLKTAAEELGVDFDSDEFAAEEARRTRGRGSTMRIKQKAAEEVPKAELSKWKSELKGLLSTHLNLGVSERYLAGGGVDVNLLLDAGKKNQFLNRRERKG